MKRNLKLTAMLLAVIFSLTFTACGDDDEPTNVDKRLYGTWLCTDAEVTNVSAKGMDLPESFLDGFAEMTENSLIGSVTQIDAKKVKVKGKVIVFEESGISWEILSLTDSRMSVKYNTTTTFTGLNLSMTVNADFQKQ